MRNNKIIFLLVNFFISTIILAGFKVDAAEKKLKWYSFNEGIEQVTKEKKPAIVDFYADWCGWCKEMDSKTFNNPDVNKILSGGYILIRINTDKNETFSYKGKKYTTQELQYALKITGLPTVAFLDKNADFITTLPGFVPAEQFKAILGYMSNECYTKKVAFPDYVKNKQSCK